MRRIICACSLLLGIVLLVFFLRSPRAAEVEHHTFMVDPQGNAAYCLLCHNGTTAKSVSNCIGINCTIGFSDSHPVNKPYPAAPGGGSFAPLGDLSTARIRLIEGQVSCISCHDLQNPAPSHPVMDNGRSNLCRSCHRK